MPHLKILRIKTTFISTPRRFSPLRLSIRKTRRMPKRSSKSLGMAATLTTLLNDDLYSSSAGRRAREAELAKSRKPL